MSSGRLFAMHPREVFPSPQKAGDGGSAGRYTPSLDGHPDRG
jgi:hypothetical protein